MYDLRYGTTVCGPWLMATRSLSLLHTTFSTHSSWTCRAVVGPQVDVDGPQVVEFAR